MKSTFDALKKLTLDLGGMNLTLDLLKRVNVDGKEYVAISNDSPMKISKPKSPKTKVITRKKRTVHTMKRWVQEHDTTMREMREAGKSWDDIAKVLGRTVKSCTERWHKRMRQVDVKQGKMSIIPDTQGMTQQ